MYYRRKVILSLLQVFGNELNKTDFQKYLFLFTRMQEKPSYDFVPYKYGCFSFQSLADKRTMEKYGLLAQDNKWEKIDKKNYIDELTPDDRKNIIEFKERYGKLKGKELIRYVYSNYPYYAIKSTIANEMLTPSQYKNVVQEIPTQKNVMLFTIGYEGKSFETYLNELIKNNIKLLCDVRKNPVSMKFGFSKNQLKSALEQLNIEYVHLPELGIESNKRQNLDTDEAYQILLKNYEENTLPNKSSFVEQLFRLLLNKKRIALTCFESNYNNCHRSRVSNAIQTLPEWKYSVKHI